LFLVRFYLLQGSCAVEKEERLDHDCIVQPCAAANPAITLRYHTPPPLGRVADLWPLIGSQCKAKIYRIPVLNEAATEVQRNDSVRSGRGCLYHKATKERSNPHLFLRSLVVKNLWIRGGCGPFSRRFNRIRRRQGYGGREERTNRREGSRFGL
jgi:hypothetical protein